MKPKKNQLYLLLFFLIFLSLTLGDLISKPLMRQELCMILGTSSRPINYLFIRTGLNHPPLWDFMQHFCNILFGIGPVASRLLPLLFGLLSIFMIHKLARLMFSQGVANLSAFFLAISPMLIEYSRIAEKYTLFAFLSMLSFYTFIRFLRNGARKNLVFFLLSSFFLAHTHFYSIFMFLVEFLYVSLTPSHRHKTKKFIFIFLIIFLTFIPQIILSTKYGFHTFPHTEPWHDNLYPPTRSHFYFLYLGLIGEGIGHYGLLFFVVFYSLYFIQKNKDAVSRLFFILCPLFFFLISFFIYVRHKHIIFLLPFYLIYLSKYILAFNEKIKYSLVIVIIILNLLWLSDIRGYTEKVDYISFIESEYLEGDMLFVDGFEAFRIEYYSDMKYMNFSFYDLSNPSNIINLTDGRKWFIYTNEQRYNNRYYFNNSTINWLRENCVLMHDEGMEDIYLC